MKIARTLIFLALSSLFYSCGDRTEEAKAVVSSFFASATDESLTTTDYYPDFESLNITLRSDVSEFIGELKEKNDTLVLTCVNSFTNERGIFRQDTVHFFMKDNPESKRLEIISSKGLVFPDQSLSDFGYRVGAYKLDNVFDDHELSHRNSMLSTMYLQEYFKWQRKLKDGIEIVSWSWETSDYSGDPHGKATIKSSLPFTVKNIKYEVTYYDSNGSYMSEDSGTACSELHPDEKYNFTWWSSHAYRPRRASLNLKFSDNTIMDYIKRYSYSGNEYDEYINSLIE